MIELKDLSVEFNTDGKTVRAVDHVNLKVNRGDIYGIVGFSGAGKSTLVRTINLLQTPTSGEVYVNGENLLKLPPSEVRKRRQKIGMIFQHFNLFASRTILENVIYPIRKDKSLSNIEKREKAMELLKIVGIDDKADNYPNALSGGQRQRAAIARALISDPEVLLCDEATSALDPKTTRQILELLKNLNAQLDLTIIIITHEMMVVKEICNRCAVMENGKIIENKSTLEIFSDPQESVTQNFVATSNNSKEMIRTLDENGYFELLDDNEWVAEIKFVGTKTLDPIIFELSERYNLRSSILAGNIEFITNTPVGNLILKVQDENHQYENARAYLANKGITLHLIKKGGR